MSTAEGSAVYEAYERLSGAGPEWGGNLSNHGPMAVEVLATWWPRLLPGIAAGATHGLIRTGHAMRTLLSDSPERPAVVELGRGLACWAARLTQLPGWSDSVAGLRSYCTPWSAVAAIVSGYAPAHPSAAHELPAHHEWPQSVDVLFELAVAHADKHVLKFSDTAAQVYDRTGDSRALAAGLRAARLIPPRAEG